MKHTSAKARDAWKAATQKLRRCESQFPERSFRIKAKHSHPMETTLFHGYDIQVRLLNKRWWNWTKYATIDHIALEGGYEYCHMWC